MRNQSFLLLMSLFIVICFGISFKSVPPKGKVIIGYAGGFRGPINTDSMKVEMLTHLNYAFADIKDNVVYLHNEATDTINLRNLVMAKKRNPSLKIILSVGGWSWSGRFSDAALTETSRQAFASSAAALVRRFNLDGIDIDWEYPGQIGAGNIFRDEDKQNFTLMLKALRSSIDSISTGSGRPQLLTMAAGADSTFLLHTNMKEAQKYLDYINLMTYDFKDDGDPIAGHHTNLYASASGNKMCTDLSVKNYIAAGVPANKIVVGSGFYGRGWKLKAIKHKGLYDAASGDARAGGYSYLKDSVIGMHGYKRYWDDKAKAPYLFNERDSIFISYDDEESLTEKCRYVQKNQLAGMMLWEYFEDNKCYLLNTMNKELK